MASGGPVPPAHGGTFDDGAYRAMVGLARHTSWLNGVLEWWSDYGFALFAVLALIGLWRSRGQGPEAVARVLWVPGAMTAAVAISALAKLAVGEQRPCRVLPVGHIVALCPGSADYSFPSNHAVLAAAAAVALWAVDRRFGIVAMVNAVVIAVSRVYIGVHYPHDVLVGLLLGALVAWAGWRVGRVTTRVRSRVAH